MEQMSRRMTKSQDNDHLSTIEGVDYQSMVNPFLRNKHTANPQVKHWPNEYE